MLSLYLHIPFCKAKCKYCSFFVTPENLVEEKKMSVLKEQYHQILLQQIAFRKEKMPHEQIKTLYIGGWTPFQLWTDALIDVIETIFQKRDCEHLEELSIELNPDPIPEVLAFVEQLSKKRTQLYRLRFSFGIQSLDDNILTESGRAYTYSELTEFFRSLRLIKWSNVCYNADFIAFGTSKKQDDDDTIFLPRQEEQRSFFEKLVNSYVFDGFSIYTLELFPGSDRYNSARLKNESIQQESSYGTKESIYDEFDRMATTIADAGYARYELSNFALLGKRSLHNTVYRTMQPYLGLGINASSMLTKKVLHDNPTVQELLQSKENVRFKTQDQWKALGSWTIVDKKSIVVLDSKARLIEELMLKLRTDQRISDRSRYASILEKNRASILTTWTEAWYIEEHESWRQMTRTWLDLYNTLITDLIEF